MRHLRLLRHLRPLRRLPRFGLFGMVGAAGLAALITGAVAARLAAAPVSLAPLAPDVRAAISEKLYYAYDVKFEDFDLLWSDGFGNLGVRLTGVAVADYSLQDIATVPEIVIGLDPWAALTGRDAVRAIAVRGANVRWIKTAGGAVKFDIGAENPGDSGKILEDFLITMASAPDPEAAGRKALPMIRILDSRISISSEVDGPVIEIADADILVAPHTEGVRSTFDLVIDRPATPLTISAEGYYSTADQRMTVTATITDLKPRDIWPDGDTPLLAFMPDEPLSGTMAFTMDKYFGIDGATVDLQGPETTIETTATADAETVRLNTRMILAQDSLGETWPAWMRSSLAAWISMDTSGASPRTLSLDGEIGRHSGHLAMRGNLSHSGAPLSLGGTIDAPALAVGGDG